MVMFNKSKCFITKYCERNEFEVLEVTKLDLMTMLIFLITTSSDIIFLDTVV